MKPFTNSEFLPYRQMAEELKIVGATGNPHVGIFVVPSTIDRRPLRIVASAVDGWDHVSISRRDRVPNWYEMCQIKELFFEPNEPAMQLHPPRSEWVNNAKNCLHLFRPWSPFAIPMPPSILVGVKEVDAESLSKMSAAQIATIRDRAIQEA